jgi:hypothetical protein
LSYMDNGNSDSDGSADSFYERSFEAIESLLESELFTDDIQTSESEFQSESSTNKANSSLNLLEESPINVARRQFFSSACSNSISILAARLSNSKIPFGCTNSGKDDEIPESNRKSRLVRSEAILEKLKNLEQSSQFHKEDHLTSAPPSFEGIKSIQERRKELELWKQGRLSNVDEYETSSQHSTSTINTVIELSPSKNTSRRCSDTDDSSSGGNSPLTARAVSRSLSRHDDGKAVEEASMPSKGWVKLLVGKLQNVEGHDTAKAD